MDQQVSDIKSDVSDTAEHPSTTTISTVAVQAGKAKIVLAILRVSLFFVSFNVLEGGGVRNTEIHVVYMYV